MEHLRQEVARLLSEIHGRSGIPGISVSVTVGGEQLDAAVGTTAVGSGIPMSARSGFQIGCITKLITSLVAMDLIIAGKLSLDAPIGEYLPELAALPIAGAIRVRHLGAHCSGYQGLNPALPQFGYYYSWEKFVEFMRATRQVFAAGTTFNYEHTECVLLGEIVQRLEGRSLQSIVREKILEPLNLKLDKASAWSGTESVVADHDLDSATGQYRSVRAMPFCDFWTPSLANAVAGTRDLATLAESIIGVGPSCELGAEALKSVQTQLIRFPPVCGGLRHEQMPLSFGFGCAEYSGSLFGHNGSSRGQTCGVRFDQDRGLVIVVALNAWQPHVRDYLLNSIARLAAPAKIQARRASESEDMEPQDLEGTYEGCVHGSQLKVSWHAEELSCELCDLTGKPRARLIMARDEDGRWMMKSDAGHMSIGFFREKDTRKPCLMLGMNAFKRLHAAYG